MPDSQRPTTQVERIPDCASTRYRERSTLRKLFTGARAERIMPVPIMRVAQLRQADLNLLVVFAVLAEERNISRAAKRLLLSQPAVTRAMQRLRDMFHDDLLVRVSGDYELTPKGERLLKEVSASLPRLDRLLFGEEFLPAQETAHFRLAGTDYAAHVIGVPLAKHLLSAGKALSFEMTPLNDAVFDSMERGQIDLLLHANDGRVPSHFRMLELFQEEFVCAVAKNGPYRTRITLPQYLKGVHVGVSIFSGSQTIPDQRLAAQGLTRRCIFSVPDFYVAMRMVEGTELIATIPKRIAVCEPANPRLRIHSAPKPLFHFKYMMIWHPRMESDPAHAWLRGAVRRATEDLCERKR